MGLIKTARSVTLTIAAAAIAIGASAVSADSNSHTCDGFLPPNNLKIPVGPRLLDFNGNPGGITEDQFNAVMDRMEKLFTDDVTKAGGHFVINRNWEDPTVNAYANQDGNDWVINMFGGLARHPSINIEGMALVACHELGHHMGGAPKEVYMAGPWATDEGGADYFATLKCLRKFFAQDDNATIVAGANLEPIAKTQCAKEFTAPADVLICERSAMAGASVANLFMDLSGSAAPSFSTPDTSEVDVTFDNHPATQCRMDTYFAGATCHADASVPNSNTDYKAGTCVQGVDDVGFRPRCWFKGD